MGLSGVSLPDAPASGFRPLPRPARFRWLRRCTGMTSSVSFVLLVDFVFMMLVAIVLMEHSRNSFLGLWAWTHVKVEDLGEGHKNYFWVREVSLVFWVYMTSGAPRLRAVENVSSTRHHGTICAVFM